MRSLSFSTSPLGCALTLPFLCRAKPRAPRTPKNIKPKSIEVNDVADASQQQQQQQQRDDEDSLADETDHDMLTEDFFLSNNSPSTSSANLAAAQRHLAASAAPPTPSTNAQQQADLATSATRTEVQPVPRPAAPMVKQSIFPREPTAPSVRDEGGDLDLDVSEEQQAAIALVGVGFAQDSPRLGGMANMFSEGDMLV